MLMGSPATLGAWGAIGALILSGKAGARKERSSPRTQNDHKRIKRRGAESAGGIPSDRVGTRQPRSSTSRRFATWAPQRHPGHKERAPRTEKQDCRVAALPSPKAF